MELDNLGNPAETQPEPTTNTADPNTDAAIDQPTDAVEEPRRRGAGAPFGNTNRMKHGMKSQRTGRNGFTCSRLHKKLGTYYGDVIKMRRAIERVLIQQYGGIDLLKQAKIQSLCRLETACRCLEWTERSNEKMPSEELKSQRHSIAQWTFQRDNLLAELLGQKTGIIDPWASFDVAQRPGMTLDTPTDSDATVGDAGVVEDGFDAEGNSDE